MHPNLKKVLKYIVRRDVTESLEDRLAASEETVEQTSDQAHQADDTIQHIVVSETLEYLPTSVKNPTTRNIDLNDCFVW